MVEEIIVNTFLICIFSLIFVGVNIIVGLKIISRYFDYKATIFLLIGTAWLGMSLPWVPETLKFFFLIFTPQIEPLSLMILYLVVNNVMSPFFLILWVIAMNKLTGLKDLYKKGLLIATLIIVALFELIILILVAINPALLLNQSKGIDGISITRYTVFWRFVPISIFQIFMLIIVLSTGLYFANESFNSDDFDVKLKGKFLFIAFISFTIGGLLDALFDVETLFGTIMKIIARIILMSCSVEFFLGFILPERVKLIFR
jgi:hypothetical protein